jgi:hypothetical protein
MIPMRFKLRSPNPAATSKRRTCSGLGSTSPVMVKRNVALGMIFSNAWLIHLYIYNIYIIYTYIHIMHTSHMWNIYVERERGVLCAYICVHIYIYNIIDMHRHIIIYYNVYIYIYTWCINDLMYQLSINQKGDYPSHDWRHTKAFTRNSQKKYQVI